MWLTMEVNHLATGYKAIIRNTHRSDVYSCLVTPPLGQYTLPRRFTYLQQTRSGTGRHHEVAKIMQCGKYGKHFRLRPVLIFFTAKGLQNLGCRCVGPDFTTLCSTYARLQRIKENIVYAYVHKLQVYCQRKICMYSSNRH